MDAHFDPDVANEKSSPKKRTAIATIALSALVGVAGGLGAFGIANAMQDGDPQHTASSEADGSDSVIKDDKSGTESDGAQSESAGAQSKDGDGKNSDKNKDKDKDHKDKDKSESLVPVTTKQAPGNSSNRGSGSSRTTKTVTKTQSAQSESGHRDDDRPAQSQRSGRDEANSEPTTSAAPREGAAAAGAHEAVPTTSAARAAGGEVRAENVGNGAEMSVVPEPVSRPITTTVNTSAPAAPTTTTAVPSTTTQQGAAGQSQTQPTTMAPVAQQRAGQEGHTPSQGGTSESDVPAGPPPAPIQATNEELEKVLRSATSPATEDKERIAQFEQGEAARPVIDRFMSLSTGSVPLMGWNLQGPVQVRDGRAETRLKLQTLLPSPDYPAVFVWKDGRWVVSAQTTCELARNMQMPCPA